MRFMQYVSDILKRWVVIDVKSKYALRSSGISSFKKVILGFFSCFEYLRPNHPIIIGSFYQAFL